MMLVWILTLSLDDPVVPIVIDSCPFIRKYTEHSESRFAQAP
jgi:hypothetical protein